MLFRVSFFVTLLLTSASCSSSLFTGTGEDLDVLKSQKTHTSHSECASIDLSKRDLDAPTFKKMLHCFNASGDLEALDRFTNTLDEQEMPAIVSLANGLLGLAPDLSTAEFFKLLEDALITANQSLSYPDVRSGVDFLRKERTTSGQSFFLRPFELVKSFHLTEAESSEASERLSRLIDDGRLDRMIQGLPLFITREEPVLRPLYDASSAFFNKGFVRESRAFLNQAALFIKHPEFPEFLKFVENSALHFAEPTVSEPYFGTSYNTIYSRVQSQECVLDPGSARARTLQIIDDYQNQVTTWDLVNGFPRRSWEYSEIKAVLEPVLDKISSPTQSDPNQPLWKGVLKTLHQTPEVLLSWMRDRSVDDQPILYFYPGEKTPRVRLINSLERLELILINSDFSYGFLIYQPGNNAYNFMAEIAKSWGDEPPEKWPEEIRNQFPNPTPGKSWPNTLRETYEEMLNTLNDFVSFAGTPDLPVCDARNSSDTFQSNALGLIPFDVKVRLFNMKQLIDVIKDNLPDSKTPFAGGMKFIRDLLFEIYISTPSQYRNPKAGEKNNFSFLTRASALGSFHQISKQLRKFGFTGTGFASENSALLDFFKTAVSSAKYPEFERISEMIFVKDLEHRLFWSFMEMIFETIANHSSDLNWIKQLAFYTIAMGENFGWTRPALITGEAILNENQDYLIDHTDVLGKMLSSKIVSQWVRSLYEQEESKGKLFLGSQVRSWLEQPSLALDGMNILKALEKDSQISDSLNLFATRLEVLLDSSDFKSSGLEEISKDLLHFFEEMPAEGEPQIAKRVREFLVARMQTEGLDLPSDLEEFWRLTAKHPDEVYQILENFTRHLENGDLGDLQGLLRRALRR